MLKLFLARTDKDLATRLFAALGSFASLIGLLLTVHPDWSSWGFWQTLLALVASLSLGGLVCLELKTLSGRRVYAASDRDGIRQYMHEWLSTGGRAAIWTRDLSWVTEDGTRELLRQKARQHELVICLPTRTELTVARGG